MSFAGNRLTPRYESELPTALAVTPKIGVTMRNLSYLAAAVLALGSISTPASGQDTLSGSGSTFIKPIMDKWIAEYTKANGGAINYQSQGSGAGVKQMTDGAVDFGCTDAFMKQQQMTAAKNSGGEVTHVPLAMGAIAVAYNLPGVDKQLNFTGPVLADIFLGNITRWNDPKLQDINPGVGLPNREIATIHRADASGSTAIFTEFLSKHSDDWKARKLGAGTTVNWPVGVGENQTAGVAGAITKSQGSIGYVELFYALQNKIPFGAVQNKEGQFIAPSLESVSAAGAAKVEAKDVRTDLRYSLVDAPGKNSYPLSGTTWAVLYVNQRKQAKALKNFFTWILHDGQSFAKAMDYAPLPKELVQMAQDNVDKITGP
jgi:phosphate ABC transporter phosphate-binding protein